MRRDKDLLSSRSSLETQYSHSALSSQPYSFPQTSRPSGNPQRTPQKNTPTPKAHILKVAIQRAKPAFPYPTLTLQSTRGSLLGLAGHLPSIHSKATRTIISQCSLPQIHRLFQSLLNTLQQGVNSGFQCHSFPCQLGGAVPLLSWAPENTL